LFFQIFVLTFFAFLSWLFFHFFITFAY